MSSDNEKNIAGPYFGGLRDTRLVEEVDAQRRVETLEGSAAYIEADRDIDFLNSPEARGPRLQLDYQKAELLLQEHRLTDAIVVFGSTRLREPRVALENLQRAQAAALAAPEDDALRHGVVIAQQLVDKSHYYTVAHDFGALVGAACDYAEARRLTIVTGGGPGIMEAANRGAYDAGAPTVGLNIALVQDQQPNAYITPGLCFRFHYFAIRKLHFLLRARALVAFPGGYGTLDELFETLTLVQTRVIAPLPIILVGEAYWRQAINFDFLVSEGVIDAKDRQLFSYAETADEIWRVITHWQAASEQPLG
ncbi:MAG: TIGR00730 family Rossman fold protein [Methylocystis sp.]